ncbi:MAG TPA: biotin-dependent carboxyltransferase family protein [Gemmatimonadaceae bacterium]|jgi:biotin-dependent carboxylase-like uncharacterized protein|nr:biotin-dependent carboxyltransferase family protein [Gemmatimonadaceae bacterium]
MITVVKAPPFATIQDLGRRGFRDSGVPVSGVADRDSALRLNASLGNDPNAAMIEWAVAGGVLRFEVACTVAIGGAEAECSIGGRPPAAFRPVAVPAGAELTVARLVRGRYLLLAVGGGIDVPVVLRSRSTLLSAGIGGLDGRRLRTGDTLPIGSAKSGGGEGWRQDQRVLRSGAIAVRRGPQAALFGSTGWSAFIDAEFTISRASDRTGYRLEGRRIESAGGGTLPSEPTCVGAIQVPAGGDPIVLMNDGPTIGGYPKIAVIRSAWISRFAQLTPGARVRFILDEESNRS